MAEIYKITNRLNNNVYIGQTTQGVQRRFRQHIEKALSGGHGKLHTAMRECGIENFDIEVIERCEEECLDDREKYWISHYNSMNNGYNMTAGGNGGSIYSIDYALICKLWDEGNSLGNISKIIGCPVHSISVRLRGYDKFSEEESFLRSNCKKVYQYDLAGMYLDTFDSTQDAEAYFNNGVRNKDNIAACARGDQKTAYNYWWSYNKIPQGPILWTEKHMVYPVVQYDKKMNYIRTYENVKAAEKAMIELGYKRPHIYEVCQRQPKYNTSCGYIWRSIYDPEVNIPVKSSVAELATLLDD